MKPVLVRDLPTRLFHWLLIGTTIQLGKINHHNSIQREDDDD